MQRTITINSNTLSVFFILRITIEHIINSDVEAHVNGEIENVEKLRKRCYGNIMRLQCQQVSEQNRVPHTLECEWTLSTRCCHTMLL